LLPLAQVTIYEQEIIASSFSQSHDRLLTDLPYHPSDQMQAEVQSLNSIRIQLVSFGAEWQTGLPLVSIGHFSPIDRSYFIFLSRDGRVASRDILTIQPYFQAAATSKAVLMAGTAESPTIETIPAFRADSFETAHIFNYSLANFRC
jgi:hypothetical protein